MAIAKYDGPCYLRFGRPKWPVFIPEDMPFEIGKALMLSEGKDVTIFATGHMVWKAIEAGHADFWRKYVGLEGDVVGINRFGESAPAPSVYSYLGVTADRLASLV